MFKDWKDIFRIQLNFLRGEKMERIYDVIIWGASGFTGLVGRY